MKSSFLTRFGPPLAVLMFAWVSHMPSAHGFVLDRSGYVCGAAAQVCKIVADAHNIALNSSPTHYSALEQLEAFATEYLRRPEGSEPLDDAALASYATLLAPIDAEGRQQLVELMAVLEQSSPAEDPFPIDFVLVYGSHAPQTLRRLELFAAGPTRQKFELGPGTQVIFYDAEQIKFAQDTLEVLVQPRPLAPEQLSASPAQQGNDLRFSYELVNRNLWLPTVLRDKPIAWVHAPRNLREWVADSQAMVRQRCQQASLNSCRALVIPDDSRAAEQRWATLVTINGHEPSDFNVVFFDHAWNGDDETSDAALGMRLHAFATSLSVARQWRDASDATIQNGLQP